MCRAFLGTGSPAAAAARNRRLPPPPSPSTRDRRIPPPSSPTGSRAAAAARERSARTPARTSEGPRTPARASEAARAREAAEARDAALAGDAVACASVTSESEAAAASDGAVADAVANEAVAREFLRSRELASSRLDALESSEAELEAADSASVFFLGERAPRFLCARLPLEKRLSDDSARTQAVREQLESAREEARVGAEERDKVLRRCRMRLRSHFSNARRSVARPEDSRSFQIGAGNVPWMIESLLDDIFEFPKRTHFIDMLRVGRRRG